MKFLIDPQYLHQSLMYLGDENWPIVRYSYLWGSNPGKEFFQDHLCYYCGKGLYSSPEGVYEH